jgi:hypothetical protein
LWKGEYNGVVAKAFVRKLKNVLYAIDVNTLNDAEK